MGTYLLGLLAGLERKNGLDTCADTSWSISAGGWMGGVVDNSRRNYYEKDTQLVRQPHLVMFEALSMVLALFRSGLVDPSQYEPFVGVVARVVGWIAAHSGPKVTV